MRDDQEKRLFRQAMSWQTAPEDLVADTLNKMHVQYDKNMQEKEKPSLVTRMQHSLRISRNKFVMGGLAVAMAAVICISAYRPDSVKLKFDEFVYQPDMRMEMGLRAGIEGEESTSAIRDELEEKMPAKMDKYVRTEYNFHDFAMNAQGPVLWVAQAVYDGENGESFRIAVTNFPTAVHDALGSGAAMELSGVSVYTGKDKETGDLFAVWQSDERYVQLQLPGETQWNDKALIHLLEAAAEMLK